MNPWHSAFEGTPYVVSRNVIRSIIVYNYKWKSKHSRENICGKGSGGELGVKGYMERQDKKKTYHSITWGRSRSLRTKSMLGTPRGFDTM